MQALVVLPIGSESGNAFGVVRTDAAIEVDRHIHILYQGAIAVYLALHLESMCATQRIEITGIHPHNDVRITTIVPIALTVLHPALTSIHFLPSAVAELHLVAVLPSAVMESHGHPVGETVVVVIDAIDDGFSTQFHGSVLQHVVASFVIVYAQAYFECTLLRNPCCLVAIVPAGGLCLRHAQEGQHSHEQEAHACRESFCHPATVWRSDELFVSRCHIVIVIILELISEFILNCISNHRDMES